MLLQSGEAVKKIQNGTQILLKKERSWNSSLCSQMHACIDSLPLDALVQILCKLDHDELQPLVTVSKLFRDAVHVAKKLHFDFKTPAAKKTLSFTSPMEESPDAQFVRLVSKQPRKFRLPEKETQKIAIVLFPL